MILHEVRFDFVSGSATKIHTKGCTEHQLQYKNADGRMCTYSITAFIQHDGDSPNSGHYFSFLRDNEIADVWWKLEDARDPVKVSWQDMQNNVQPYVVLCTLENSATAEMPELPESGTLQLPSETSKNKIPKNLVDDEFTLVSKKKTSSSTAEARCHKHSDVELSTSSYALPLSRTFQALEESAPAEQHQRLAGMEGMRACNDSNGTNDDVSRDCPGDTNWSSDLSQSRCTRATERLKQTYAERSEQAQQQTIVFNRRFWCDDVHAKYTERVNSRALSSIRSLRNFWAGPGPLLRK